MKKSALFLVLLASMTGISLALIGCSHESSSKTGAYAEAIDSAARDMSGQAPAGSSFAAVRSASDYQIGAPELPTINDLYSDSDLVYGAYDQGFLIYNLKTADYTIVPVEDDLRAIAVHNDTIYVGGDNLYELCGIELKAIDTELPGQINELCSFGLSLMIGTDSGLYARSLSESMQLLDNLDVTAMVTDGTVLWIGTSEDGLYRYDGDVFQQRCLSRDSSLFDNVSALAFSHDHLYLGTDNGMFVYDGGRWETVSVEQGMPSNEIVSIDADGWVVYVGTAGGTVTWYQEIVRPVKHLDESIVTALCRSGNRIIAGTLYEGLAIKNGPAITLVSAPWRTDSNKLASSAQ